MSMPLLPMLGDRSDRDATGTRVTPIPTWRTPQQEIQREDCQPQDPDSEGNNPSTGSSLVPVHGEVEAPNLESPGVNVGDLPAAPRGGIQASHTAEDNPNTDLTGGSGTGAVNDTCRDSCDFSDENYRQNSCLRPARSSTQLCSSPPLSGTKKSLAYQGPEDVNNSLDSDANHKHDPDQTLVNVPHSMLDSRTGSAENMVAGLNSHVELEQTSFDPDQTLVKVPHSCPEVHPNLGSRSHPSSAGPVSMVSGAKPSGSFDPDETLVKVPYSSVEVDPNIGSRAHLSKAESHPMEHTVLASDDNDLNLPSGAVCEPSGKSYSSTTSVYMSCLLNEWKLLYMYFKVDQK